MQCIAYYMVELSLDQLVFKEQLLIKYYKRLCQLSYLDNFSS
jgi:hypothetical protein